jgi:hypothetical protein
MERFITGSVIILGKETFVSVFRIEHNGSLFAMKRTKLCGLRDFDE